MRAHGVLLHQQQLGQPPVGKPGALQPAHVGDIDVFQLAADQRLLLEDDVLDLRQEPRVDMREAVDLFQRHAAAVGVGNVKDAFRTGIAQLIFDDVNVRGFFVKAVNTGFQAAQGFLH